MNSEDIATHFEEKQRELCAKYNIEFSATPLETVIGVALETFNAGLNPINGLRHSNKTDSNTWYLWAGEYSSKADFFKPVHVAHLLEVCPQALVYLGLSPGWRFLFDNKGYEDVWCDENL